MFDKRTIKFINSSIINNNIEENMGIKNTIKKLIPGFMALAMIAGFMTINTYAQDDKKQ